MWGRVLDNTPGVKLDDDPDSFWVRADDGPETGWFYGCQTIMQAAGYRWLRVTSGMLNQSCNAAQPWTLNLTAGSHTVHLRNREPVGDDNVAAIARVLVTNDLDYVPAAPD